MDYGKVYKDSIINLININEKLINSVDKKAVFVICDDDTR